MSRWRTRDRVLLWAVAVAAAATLVLTGIAFLGGDDEETGPQDGAPPEGGSSASSYAPPDEWTEPEWVALPQGKQTDGNGNPVGFPRTTEGALAVMEQVSRVDVPKESLADNHENTYRSYLPETDRTPELIDEIRSDAADTERSMRTSADIPTSGPWPKGAYYRTTTVGVHVEQASKSLVVAYTLDRTVVRASGGGAEQEGLVATPQAVQWVDGDWRIARDYLEGLSDAQQQQLIDGAPEAWEPGDKRFKRDWTAIREGSTR